MIVGVSLKMYFGHRQTLAWAARVRDLVALRAPSPVGLFVLPSFPSLAAVADVLSGTLVELGAQDLSADDDGAQTGEVGGAVLAELGCRYVEVGHAERRSRFGEDETTVAAKTAAAFRHGLVPVLCLGEARTGTPAAALDECRRQLDSALSLVGDPAAVGPVVLAYEPHWAIGAAEPASADHIGTVCSALREDLAARTPYPGSSVIYGGSAGPGLLTRLGGSVDGLFLGRFAHDPGALGEVLREADALVGRPEPLS